MKILITGFEAFHKDKINSSWETIKMISQQEFIHDIIITESLPVSFSRVVEKIEDLLQIHRPDLFLMIGQSSNCKALRLEEVAQNLKNATIADNDGETPRNRAICAQGEQIYHSNLPLENIKKDLIEEGIPVYLSDSAGSFVCNCAFYCALRQQKLHYPTMRVGFIHVPLLEEQKSFHPNGYFVNKEFLRHAIHQLLRTLLKQN